MSEAERMRLYDIAFHRMVTPPFPREEWLPIRTINQEQVCWFCGFVIPKGRPGATTGTRGTKAWWFRAKDTWECLGCRSEAVRAEVAAKFHTNAGITRGALHSPRPNPDPQGGADAGSPLLLPLAHAAGPPPAVRGTQGQERAEESEA